MFKQKINKIPFKFCLFACLCIFKSCHAMPFHEMPMWLQCRRGSHTCGGKGGKSATHAAVRRAATHEEERQASQAHRLQRVRQVCRTCDGPGKRVHSTCNGLSGGGVPRTWGGGEGETPHMGRGQAGF